MLVVAYIPVHVYNSVDVGAFIYVMVVVSCSCVYVYIMFIYIEVCWFLTR